MANAATTYCVDGTATQVLKCQDGCVGGVGSEEGPGPGHHTSPNQPSNHHPQPMYYKDGTYSAGSTSNTCNLCTSQGTYEKTATASSGAMTLTLTNFADVSVGMLVTG